MGGVNSVQVAKFKQGFPGKLVPIQSGIHAYVPDPLPETLDLDLATVKLLARAENALGRLEGSLGRLANPLLVGQPLMRREAILSSRIEGTITTPRKLAFLEVGVTENRAVDNETREVFNYIQAMSHGQKLLKNLPICLRLMRELHAVLLGGVRGDADRPGEFRQEQNYLGTQGQGIANARFVPPPASELRRCLQELEAYLNPSTPNEPELPLLIRLALSHYQFETIHPFRDGNGRVGRLLIPLILCNEQRMSAPTLFMSGYFERHRGDYVDLMLNVSRRGDWLTWIGFFLRGVVECAQDSCRRVDALTTLHRQYHDRFHSARSSALLLKLIDALFERLSITIKGAAQYLNVAPASASRYVQQLVDAEILTEITGKKRDRLYLASAIVTAAGDDDEVEGEHPLSQ